MIANLSEQIKAGECNSFLNSAQPGLSGLENSAFFSQDLLCNPTLENLENDNILNSSIPFTLSPSLRVPKEGSLTKGTNPPVSRDHDQIKPSLKPQKKVGFKSFLIKFFTQED